MESSQCTTITDDSGSNWSEEFQGMKKLKCIALLATDDALDEADGDARTDAIQIRLVNCKFKVDPSLLPNMVPKLNELGYNSIMINTLWANERATTKQLKRKLAWLTQQAQENHDQIEEMKRKRWCRMCEEEATYLHPTKRFFYCSKLCEHKHKDFMSKGLRS